MPVPILIAALVLGQDPAAPAQAPVAAPFVPETAFQTPFAIAEPNRLALTPKIDGELSAEEWDPLVSTDALKGHLSWEPNKVHVAAKVPVGQDLLISLDLRSNGWLVGKENVEVRVTAGDTGAKITARLLDATNVNGPTWVELPGLVMASSAAAKAGADGITYEVTLVDPNLGLFPASDGKGLSIRLDGIPTAQAPIAPFIPRVLTPVSFVYRRAAAVPSGLRWGVENAGGEVMPGNAIRLRYTFNGTDKLGLKRIALRSMGPLKDETVQMQQPFPLFDPKGRAFVDYETPIRPTSEVGWRIGQSTIEAGDGLTGMVQASYRVAPILDVELVRETVKSQPREQRIKLSYYLRSNSPRRVEGSVVVTIPPTFHMISAQDKRFSINNARGGARRVLEMDLPANAKGVYPIQLRTEIDGQMFDHTLYLNID